MTVELNRSLGASFEERFALGMPWSVAGGTDEDKPPGMSAVIRACDEEQVIALAVSSLLGVVDEIVLVDNGSTDHTVTRVLEVAQNNDTSTEIRVLCYDVPISRCGAEHAQTDPDDPRSLVAFYNWAFSRARYRQSMKWDADMVATRFGGMLLSRLRLETADPTVIAFQCLPVYLRGESHATEALFDLDGRHRESYIHPSYPLSRYVKADLWERLEAPTKSAFTAWIAALELKFIDSDENRHWSSTDDLQRTARKVRELEMFEAISAGRRDADFVPVELTRDSLQEAFDQAMTTDARAAGTSS